MVVQARGHQQHRSGQRAPRQWRQGVGQGDMTAPFHTDTEGAVRGRLHLLDKTVFESRHKCTSDRGRICTDYGVESIHWYRNRVAYMYVMY